MATLSPAPPTIAASRRRSTRAERHLAYRLRRRDRTALAELHRDHGRLVLAYLTRVLDDRGAAEDVHQLVFLEAWQRADYDPRRASPATWLMTIARSRAIDHRRRRSPVPLDPADFDDAAEAGDDFEELHDDWWLSGTLSSLPDDEAETLRLRFGEDLTQSEIAETLGVPLGTVKTRMARALGRLRLELVAGALLLVVVGGVLMWPGSGSDEQRLALGPLPGQRGEAVLVTHSDGTVELDASGLKADGRGRHHELWMLREDGTPVTVGTFRVGPDGRATGRYRLPADPRGFAQFDVSEERADGNPAHSGRSVLRAPVKPS